MKLKKILGVSMMVATVLGSASLKASASVRPGEPINAVYNGSGACLCSVGDEHKLKWVKQYGSVKSLARHMGVSAEKIQRAFPNFRYAESEESARTGKVRYSIYTTDFGWIRVKESDFK